MSTVLAWQSAQHQIATALLCRLRDDARLARCEVLWSGMPISQQLSHIAELYVRRRDRYDRPDTHSIRHRTGSATIKVVDGFLDVETETCDRTGLRHWISHEVALCDPDFYEQLCKAIEVLL